MHSNIWSKKCCNPCSLFNSLCSHVGHKKPHFGELHFQEDLYTLQLTTQPDEGETHEAEKTKKIINLKGMKEMLLCFFFHGLLLSPETLWSFDTGLSQRNENVQRWNTQGAGLRRWDDRSCSAKLCLSLESVACWLIQPKASHIWVCSQLQSNLFNFPYFYVLVLIIRSWLITRSKGYFSWFNYKCDETCSYTCSLWTIEQLVQLYKNGSVCPLIFAIIKNWIIG